jgi:hypothetical protein
MTIKQVLHLGLTLTFLVPTLAFSKGQNSEAAAEQVTSAKQTPPPPIAPEPLPKPKIEGSMVGYIDDAIIASEVRVRFEGGWHAGFPDRAEFFYAKCGCYAAQLAGSGLPAYDPKAPGPQPGVATDLNFQQLYIQGEYAPTPRVSLTAEVPIRWLQPRSFVPGVGSFGNQSGLSDIRASVKANLLNKETGYLTVQMKAYFPSGDAARGLGVNHYSIEPAVLLYQQPTAHLAIESQFSFWHPIGGSAGVASASNPNPPSFAGNVLSYGIGPSYQFYTGDRIRLAPVVEFVGWRVMGGFQTVWIAANRIGDDVSGTNIANLKAGVRTSIGARNSVYVGYGRGLTNAVWYSDLVRLEYRRAF